METAKKLGIFSHDRRVRREILFCLSGDDDKQKEASLKNWSFCLIVIIRVGKYSYLSVLCVSAVRSFMKSLSVFICVNLRLIADVPCAFSIAQYSVLVTQY